MIITGVPQKEVWWLWALAVWIFFSLGPGLEFGSVPAYIGYFPVLYVWSVAFWLLSIVLALFLAFKVNFHEVPTDIEPITEEEKREGGIV